MQEKAPYGYVYKTTNKLNGKSYIGMRKLSKDRFWRQYFGSGRLLLQAISKYGEENFVKSIVCYSFDKEELQEIEWEKIQYFKSIGEAEYNLFNGKGAGGDTFSSLAGRDKEEVVRRRVEGMKRNSKINSEEQKRRSEEKYQRFL